MWQGVNTDGLAASTTADCPAWGGPPPTLQLVPQRERTESSAQGCWGTKNTVCWPALHLPAVQGQRDGLGMLVHRSQKDTQAGDLGACGHMGLWACC